MKHAFIRMADSLAPWPPILLLREIRREMTSQTDKNSVWELKPDQIF